MSYVYVLSPYYEYSCNVFFMFFSRICTMLEVIFADRILLQYEGIHAQ